MQFTPYPEQAACVADAVAFFANATQNSKRLYASPTGTGKSVMELLALEQLPDAFLVTPRLDIVAGMLVKLGLEAPVSVERLASAGQAARVWTVVRLRNALARGDITPPKQLLIDESHHDTAITYREISLLVNGIPAAGWTATPFRGTPAGTRALREVWGEPVWVMTFREAVVLRRIALPRCRVAPLIDDDSIGVVGGEFQVSEANTAVRSRLADVARLSLPYVDAQSGIWDRPTMYALPGVDSAVACREQLEAAGLPANVVTADTPQSERREIFAACVNRRAALVQIGVVSEGVDLPIRRLIDLSPTMSPVKWLQQFGRITRPTSEPPEYICCNRNLARHCYLLDGCLPSADIAQAQTAFPERSKRDGSRGVGLESLGRLKGVELPLLDGLTGLMYSFSAVEGEATVRQYSVLLHPGSADPVCATRTNGVKDDGTRDYGRWEQCEMPEITEGFTSLPPSAVSEKQETWWRRSARRHGLDPEAKVNRKNFAALPVLADLRLRFGGES